MEHDGQDALVAQAVRPVLERIERDAARVEEPIRKLLLHLCEHLSDDGLTVKEWFDSKAVRGNSVRVRFSQTLRLSPGKYLEGCRYEMALRLMVAMPRAPLREIAEICGFPQERHFYTAFKRRFGMTAGQARTGLLEGSWTISGMIADLVPEESLIECSLGDDRTSESLLDGVLWPAILKETGDAALDWVGMVTEVPTEARFRFLLRQSREGCREDRRLGVRIAEVALRSLEAIRRRVSQPEYVALRIEGLANLGNAHRLAGDCDAADHVLTLAERERGGTEIPLEVDALLTSYQGHLRTFQRRHLEASELFSRAKELWSAVGRLEPLARLGAAQGYSLCLQGRLAEARGVYEESLTLARRGKLAKSHVAYTIHSGLAWIFAATGSFEDADDQVEAMTRLAGELGQEALLYGVRWQEGLIQVARGRHGLAERRLRSALEGFETAGETVNAALVGLDLARLLISRRERPREVSVLTRDAISVLSSVRLDREALAALRILASALEESAVTVGAISKLRARLETRFGAPRWQPEVEA